MRLYLSRHCEERSDEAIYNQAYMKDSIANASDCNIIDCHEANASRNDEVANATTKSQIFRNDKVVKHNDKNQTTASLQESSFSSLRGMSEANDEAIYNVGNKNANNGIITSEILDYGLPRDSNESLAMTENQSLRHCEAERSDNEAIHNQAYMKDSIANTTSEILDYRLPRFLTESRNDAIPNTESHTTKVA